MAEVVAFDSLGTLLDLGELGESAAFRHVLHHAVCLTLAGEWRPFAEIAAAVDDELPERLQQLDAKPDARAALELVRSAGAEAWILTNGGRDATQRLVDRAGLSDVVPRIRTVEEVRRYKPAREVYQLAVEALLVKKEDVGFVSSNCWDAIGAKSFGFSVYWINRSGAPVDRTGFAPDAQLSSLGDLPAALRRA